MLKKEVCESHKQCMGPIGETKFEKHASKKKKKTNWERENADAQTSVSKCTLYINI